MDLGQEVGGGPRRLEIGHPFEVRLHGGQLATAFRALREMGVRGGARRAVQQAFGIVAQEIAVEMLIHGP